jgi:hypothetical protein
MKMGRWWLLKLTSKMLKKKLRLIADFLLNFAKFKVKVKNFD